MFYRVGKAREKQKTRKRQTKATPNLNPSLPPLFLFSLFLPPNQKSRSSLSYPVIPSFLFPNKKILFILSSSCHPVPFFSQPTIPFIPLLSCHPVFSLPQNENPVNPVFIPPSCRKLSRQSCPKIQYKNPNIQSGIFRSCPYSRLSAAI